MGIRFFRSLRRGIGELFLASIFLLCGVLVIMNNDVYGEQGGGGDTSGGAASCNDNALTTLCGDPAGSRGGGASWRIFRANNGSGLDDWTGYSEDILEDGYKDEAMTACNDAGWFVSFGWDGMYGSHYGYSNFNFQIGPANRNVGELIRSAAHNTYNAKNLEWVKANSNYANNTKITRPAALYLYNEYRKSIGKSTVTSIPDNVGWFCFNGSDENTLEVKGTNIYNGSAITDGNKSKSTTSSSTSVKRKGLGSKGYKFIGWKTKTGYDNHKSGLTSIITRTKYEDSDGNPVNSKVGVDATDSNGNVIVYDSGKKNVKSTIYVRNLSGDRTVYAYYAKQCTLTMNQGAGTTLRAVRNVSPYAGTADHNLTSGAGDTKTYNTYKDDHWVVTYGLKTGYSWGTHPNSSYTIGGSGANCNNLTLTTTAVKNKFKGKATVTGGGGSASTEFVENDRESNGGNAALLKIDCPSTGCSATFSMDLKTTQGSGSTTYDIYRDGNQVSGYVGKSIAPSGSGSNVGSFTVNMQQGDLVCYEMNFDAIPADEKIVTVEACAAAVATETASINIDIRDMTSSSSYRDWQSRHNRDYVYAKPKELVEIKGTFEPKYQYMVGLMPVTTKISSNSYSNNGRNIRTIFNANVSPNWNNAFSIDLNRSNCKNLVSNGGRQAEYTGVFLGTIGSSSAYSGVCDYEVKVSDVGENSNTAKSVTNSRDEDGGIPTTKTTPKQVALDFSFSTGFVATIDKSEIESDPVKIYVPYNFENDAKLNIIDDKFYAGEEKTIYYNLIVGTRQNSMTNGTYATNVPGAKWKLLIDYSDGVHSEIDHLNGENLNYDNYDKNGKTSSKNDGISIRDVPAGTEVCITLQFWPKYSGGDMNMQSSNFSGWAEDWKCYKIAKKPSFQVWGGSVYSAGSITEEEVPLAKKKKLDNHSDGNYLFGSWAELSLVAGGSVKGLASGAGLGYAQIGDSSSMVSVAKRLNRNGGIENPSINNVGGGDSSGNNYYCKISTLSFVNSGCVGNGSVGNLGSSSGGGASTNKHALISDFVPNDRSRFSLDGNGFSWYELNLNDAIKRLSYHVPDSEIEYYYYDSTVGGGLSVDFNSRYNPWVEKKINRGMETSAIVIDSEDDVYINSSIYYKDDGYSAIKDIPKVIIYAKENIKISCSVQRIDAVLIAEKDIDTCYDFDNINSIARSTPLTINGATISNTLNLKRTYGAATGVNSIVPAEIVNYDTSLYLWANKQADVTSSGKLTEASVRELAPRY